MEQGKKNHISNYDYELVPSFRFRWEGRWRKVCKKNWKNEDGISNSKKYIWWIE